MQHEAHPVQKYFRVPGAHEPPPGRSQVDGQQWVFPSSDALATATGATATPSPIASVLPRRSMKSRRVEATPAAAVRCSLQATPRPLHRGHLQYFNVDHRGKERSRIAAAELGGEVMANQQALADLRHTVEGFLAKSFGDSRLDADGDFEVRRHGVTTWVELRPVADDQTAVLIWSVSNVGMAAGEELATFLAVEANNLGFGQFELHEDPPRIHVSHALLGEFLSREELEVAVDAVAAAAAHYGSSIKKRFGGLLPFEQSA